DFRTSFFIGHSVRALRAPTPSGYHCLRMRKGRVEGKTIVVTGAAQGIGFACARRLAEEGASVVISDIQREAGEAAARKIRARFVFADMTSEGDCVRLMDEAAGAAGRIDGLVNNAGWYPRATLEETTTEFWDRIQDVNLRGPFYCCRFVAPYMRK